MLECNSVGLGVKLAAVVSASRMVNSAVVMEESNIPVIVNARAARQSMALSRHDRLRRRFALRNDEGFSGPAVTHTSSRPFAGRKRAWDSVWSRARLTTSWFNWCRSHKAWVAWVSGDSSAVAMSR